MPAAKEIPTSAEGQRQDQIQGQEQRQAQAQRIPRKLGKDEGNDNIE